mmetsp:Transcript_8456/g.15564  ORF Transcript_8456/g.15564 Transcript_8456/m.15564 type:complete len:83 (+) Transcript_8456:240-488(+)
MPRRGCLECPNVLFLFDPLFLAVRIECLSLDTKPSRWTTHLKKLVLLQVVECVVAAPSWFKFMHWKVNFLQRGCKEALSPHF